MLFRISESHRRMRFSSSIWDALAMALAEARAERRVLAGK